MLAVVVGLSVVRAGQLKLVILYSRLVALVGAAVWPLVQLLLVGRLVLTLANTRGAAGVLATAPLSVLLAIMLWRRLGLVAAGLTPQMLRLLVERVGVGHALGHHHQARLRAALLAVARGATARLSALHFRTACSGVVVAAAAARVTSTQSTVGAGVMVDSQAVAVVVAVLPSVAVLLWVVVVAMVARVLPSW